MMKTYCFARGTLQNNATSMERGAQGVSCRVRPLVLPKTRRDAAKADGPVRVASLTNSVRALPPMHGNGRRIVISRCALPDAVAVGHGADLPNNGSEHKNNCYRRWENAPHFMAAHSRTWVV